MIKRDTNQNYPHKWQKNNNKQDHDVYHINLKNKKYVKVRLKSKHHYL